MADQSLSAGELLDIVDEQDRVVGQAPRGEAYHEAALREAEEELGVSGLSAPVPLFRFLYDTPEHTWWSAVYEARCEPPVAPQIEEIAWYAFLTEEELHRRLAEHDPANPMRASGRRRPDRS